MDAFWYDLVGWNPIYRLFNYSETNLALTTMLILAALAGVALVTNKRLLMAGYLVANGLVVYVIYLAIDNQPYAVAYTDPWWILAWVSLAVIILAVLTSIAGAFGRLRTLEAKHGYSVSGQNPRSLRAFRFSAYMLVGSVLLAIGTGLAQFFVDSWVRWLFENVDYPAWVAILVFACTTVLTGLWHLGVATKRRVAAKRQRQLDADADFTYIGDDKRAIHGEPINEHPDGTRSGTITNLAVGRRTPDGEWDQNRRDYDQT